VSTRIHTLTPLPLTPNTLPPPFSHPLLILQNIFLLWREQHPSSRSLNTGACSLYSYCIQPKPKNQRDQCSLFSVVFISHGENVSGLHFTLYRKKCKRNWRTLHGSVWLLLVISLLLIKIVSPVRAFLPI
jgi:hypothetical protein